MTDSDLAAAPLRIGYERAEIGELLLQSDVLAVIGFGAGAGTALCDDPRVLCVGLEPLQPAPLEVWRTHGTVACGREGALRWSEDGDYLFVAIEIDETAHEDIRAAAQYAYHSLTDFVAASATPHLLRLWNYLDAINVGAADAERYRLFCDGRARGMHAMHGACYPAASAIGRQDGVRVLQVYGLASRTAGTPVENPRQISAWRYPRQYGPTAPTFARGMLNTPAQLLISGTAAVVGHASRHRDDLAAQVAETMANLDSLVQQAGARERSFGPHSFLKAYVRDHADAPFVAETVQACAPTLGGLLLLGGDICRRELLVEIDGVHPLGD
ncbi:MAG: pteridine-dependent deoxygenase [Dokdonella sp.]